MTIGLSPHPRCPHLPCRFGVRGRGPFSGLKTEYAVPWRIAHCDHSDPARGAEAPPPSALPAGAAVAPVSPPFELGAGSRRPPLRGAYCQRGRPERPERSWLIDDI